VLHTDAYPEIGLISSSIKKQEADYLVIGQLTLHGHTREIAFNVRKEESSRYVVDVNLHLPDFGITPFSALLGAIRIKPDILVHIEIPAEYLPETAAA